MEGEEEIRMYLAMAMYRLYTLQTRMDEMDSVVESELRMIAAKNPQWLPLMKKAVDWAIGQPPDLDIDEVLKGLNQTHEEKMEYLRVTKRILERIMGEGRQGGPAIS